MIDLIPEVASNLVTPEQSSNYVASKINDVRDELIRRPLPPTDEMTSVVYIKWERKMLITYGIAIGVIVCAQAFGIISVDLFKKKKNELIAVILRKMADATIG